MLRKKNFLIFCILLFVLCGCGKNKELEAYSNEVTQFNTTISNIIASMDSIDTSKEDADDKLLNCLDSMAMEFERFSMVEVPSKFSNNENLAVEASNYMKEAVKFYHEVFEAEEFQQNKMDVANENYARAMNRISCISSLLSGELPEGENINISDETTPDFEPIEEN